MTELLTNQPLYSLSSLVGLALITLVVGLSLAFFRLFKTSVVVSGLAVATILTSSFYNQVIQEYSIQVVGSDYSVKNNTLYSKVVPKEQDPLLTFNSTPAVGDTTKAIVENEDVVGKVECGNLSVKECFNLLSKNIDQLKTQNNQVIDVEKLKSL